MTDGREPAAEPRLLHVTNGESAGNTLRQTTLGGAVLPWQDALHEGPVPAVPRPELLRVRARFLSQCGWGSRGALLSSLERRDRRLVEALRHGLHVVLWFEHDLYDQLQLLDALALAREVGAAPELIVVGSFLGALGPEGLESLWPQREMAADETIEAGAAAWDAFRASEPTAIVELAARTLPGLPFLAPALRRLLAELPAPGDGLSATERLALRAFADGARTPQAAFVAAQQAEEAPFLGDTWFYRVLSGLGGGRVRLVETDDGAALPAAPPLGDGQMFARLPLRLTGEGERVLAGELDRIELLGVDRWIGGTHLTAGNVWRWDPEARALVPS